LEGSVAAFLPELFETGSEETTIYAFGKEYTLDGTKHEKSTRARQRDARE
jgi:hypothetical protein